MSCRFVISVTSSGGDVWTFVFEVGNAMWFCIRALGDVERERLLGSG